MGWKQETIKDGEIIMWKWILKLLGLWKEEIIVCEVTNLLLNPYCPITIKKLFKPKDIPTKECPVHEKPIEYEYRDTCMDSGKMRHAPACPDDRIEWGKKYIKGTEPTTWCEFHKEPEPPHPVYPRREKYSLHLIDLFAYTYNHPDWDIEPLIERVAQTEASAIHSFGWAGDPGQAYDLEAIPWRWVWLDKNGNEVNKADPKRVEYLVDFNQKNPMYETTFKKIAGACKDRDRDYRHILFMSRYNFHIFRANLNKQGISHFYSPEGLAVQKEYVLDCLRWYREVGIDKPTVLLMNEPGHYGDDEQGHIIAEWHREIGDLVLQHTDRNKLWFDTSHSEYAYAYFVEPFKCPKCEFMFGREEFADRSIIAEAHGCSTLQGLLESGAEAFYGSGWKQWAVNEDGSEYGSTIAYNPDGSIAFRFANATEYRETLEYLKMRDDQTGKNSHVVGFPTGMLKLGEGDFSDLNCIDWAKYYLYKEIFGV